MSDRLDRILNLSKKTGDTVIVHDPSSEHDLVVLPFDQYEDLVAAEHPSLSGDYDDYLLEEMSERELIDKINRDIAIWRSYQELNLRDRHAAMLEDQLTDDPLPDPFEEDFSHYTDWHRVSDLMGEGRLSKLKEKALTEESGDPIRTYVPVEEERPVQGFTPRPSSTSAMTVPLESTPSEDVFEDESELSSDDNPVFLEEPPT
jgi:hypothetical protein